MNMIRTLGLDAGGSAVGQREQIIRYINLKLAALGMPTAGVDAQTGFLSVAGDLLADFQEFARLLDGYLCPADQRINNFLDEHLANKCYLLPEGNFTCCDRFQIVSKVGRDFCYCSGDFYKPIICWASRIACACI